MSWAFLKNSLLWLFMLALGFISCTLKPKAKTSARLYLASSLVPLKHSLETLAPRGLDLELLFLSSSLIAQQVANGALCDALILADREWEDYLLKKQANRFSDSRILATNTLVLAGLKPPSESTSFLQIIKNLSGPRQLIIADPNFVPLGRYSEQALKTLGVWEALQGKYLAAHSAHNARVLLEQGVAPYAILFHSDTNTQGPLYQVATLDSSLHKPVNYVFLACKPSMQAEALKKMLFSAEFKAELLKHNFGLPHEL